MIAESRLDRVYALVRDERLRNQRHPEKSSGCRQLDAPHTGWRCRDVRTVRHAFVCQKTPLRILVGIFAVTSPHRFQFRDPEYDRALLAIVVHINPLSFPYSHSKPGNAPDSPDQNDPPANAIFSTKPAEDRPKKAVVDVRTALTV